MEVKMELQGFRLFLQERKLSNKQIEEHIVIVKKFEAFLEQNYPSRSLNDAHGEEVQAFIDVLIHEKQNTYENLVGLARYGRFSRNNATFVAVLELLDGSEALEGMYSKVGMVMGEQQRDKIFSEGTLPPLGTSNAKKAQITRAVMERLEEAMDDVTYQQIFSDSFRDLRDEWYLEDKKRYHEIRDFDRFLEMKRQEFISQLEELRDTHELFFSQEITPEVVEFVRRDPEIAQGVRKGNILFVTKIPYMAKEYLAETDPDKKRYHYCHCPWARESLRVGEMPVSARFCQCSAGFHKKSWEVIFEQPLQVDVLESVLKGDMRCRFAIHLPDKLIER
jgi:hypothetical protein